MADTQKASSSSKEDRGMLDMFLWSQMLLNVMEISQKTYVEVIPTLRSLGESAFFLESPIF